ncbi:ribosome biogenesis GTP-binding protein YihA/YsxC [Williamsoniiplasma luminosum]|uniref:Probable GTP-binding protein EngB n=1 Tax=Williamsoniiplasma luminosum TaxID=214888 RepID=A0A2S0NJG5_9MOLU|nr:ribosome biogenesis GTP-binding protein YihA/YsxC [Williamsoniiplasma luminosum]AVP49151.1 MAG: YihA family ribosome biogenesis GTP-binding protein [Williamsoniiplasma luminosum]
MIKTATFIKSAADKSGWIDDGVDEICFVGRSNVGKSTFINAITNQNKLAKTSSAPGKTRLLNFFNINNGQFRIVDAPGYGYAKVNLAQKMAFGEMMDDYLTNRNNLIGVCMLVDMRHDPTADDLQMYNFLKEVDLKVLMIGTKLDKLKKNDIQKNEKSIKKILNFDENDTFLKVSNTNKTNINLVYNVLVELLDGRE